MKKDSLWIFKPHRTVLTSNKTTKQNNTTYSFTTTTAFYLGFQVVLALVAAGDHVRLYGPAEVGEALRIVRVGHAVPQETQVAGGGEGGADFVRVVVPVLEERLGGALLVRGLQWLVANVLQSHSHVLVCVAVLADTLQIVDLCVEVEGLVEQLGVQGRNVAGVAFEELRLEAGFRFNDELGYSVEGTRVCKVA